MSARPRKSNASVQPLPAITFPVLRRLSVQGYELYPGRNRKGIVHDFDNGVTVIAGVNGLGKTTLLNLIFRLLVGPRDPKKATNFEPGVASKELIRSKDRDYFSQRVADGAVDATAEGAFGFGSKTLVITRSLQDLSLVALFLDGSPVALDEDIFGDTVTRLCGVADPYDFDFVVRHLVFFLERRVPLFWNEHGQFEIFRILFFEAEMARELSNRATEIRVQDSHFRNMRWSLNQREQAYAEAKANQEKISQDAHELALLEAAIAVNEEARNRSTAELLNLTQVRRKRISELESKRLDHEEIVRGLQNDRQQFFARSFPTMPKAAAYIVGQLAAGGGCLVCGNKHQSAGARINSLLKKGVCPLCESPPNAQENVIPVGVVDAARIRDAEKRELQLQQELTKLESVVTAQDQEIASLLDHRDTEEREIAAIRRQTEEIRARVEGAPLQDELERELKQNRAELDKLRRELFRNRAHYHKLLSKARDRMLKLVEQIKSNFEAYASTFMAETCQLNYEPAEIRIGQEGDTFQCPNFNLLMTSATSPKDGSQRDGPDDVSESQREFIDLAFRMALIATVTQNQTSSMLIVETPESSLDSLFVEQAGSLLRQFARGIKRNAGNVLIASSNLNRENMIPSLLGLDGKRVAERERIATRGIINLLDLAAPNAAMRHNGQRYRAELRQLIRGRR
ncbi:MAG TPA: hypothetical protein VGW57_15425 [Chthoniobacterales bacterium]|nr:hypothetical protein [Chthoniobacterales bacterium]